MAETLFEYGAVIRGQDRNDYAARACGRERADGTWEGWIEFVAVGGPEVWRTPRETTQPNRTDLVYWATGVSPVYLEGALARATRPRPVVVDAPPSPPAFAGPAPDIEVVSKPTPPRVPPAQPGGRRR